MKDYGGGIGPLPEDTTYHDNRTLGREMEAQAYASIGKKMKRPASQMPRASGRHRIRSYVFNDGLAIVVGGDTVPNDIVLTVQDLSLGTTV